jgi:hypothetical protein
MGWTRDVSMVGGSRLGGALSRVLFERCTGGLVSSVKRLLGAGVYAGAAGC